MWGVGCNSWGWGCFVGEKSCKVGVKVRVVTGVRVEDVIRVGVRIRIWRTGREVERKRKKSEENTTKGQNIFLLIQFKITQSEKTN